MGHTCQLLLQPPEYTGFYPRGPLSLLEHRSREGGFRSTVVLTGAGSAVGAVAVPNALLGGTARLAEASPGRAKAARGGHSYGMVLAMLRR